MTKRNKKYNPKQIVKQKVHKFQMFWEVNEAKRIIEMHHLLNGVDPQESTHTPLHVWMKAHKFLSCLHGSERSNLADV